MIIGLTGGIASGKSTVAMYLKQKGIPVCDTDLLAREVVLPHTKGLTKLVERFGSQIIDVHGALNREKLGEIIFNNETAREQVNAILHPLIFEKVEQFKQQYADFPIVIIDMPLLFEVGYDKHVEQVMVIYVDEAIQYDRLINRNGLTTHQAKQRIDTQLPLCQKAKRADVVIDNNGTLEETYQQVDAYLKQLDYVIMK